MRLLMILAAFVAIAGGQSDNLESCPDVEPMQGFEIEKFLGIWYVIEETSGVRRCITNNYTQGEEAGGYKFIQDLEILFALVLPPRKYEYRITKELSIPEPSTPGTMQARSPHRIIGGNSLHIVFATDYVNYAGIFNCQSHDQPSASILSRRKFLDSVHLDLLRQKLSSFGVDSNDMINVMTADCLAGDNNDVDFNIESSSKQTNDDI